MSLGCNSGCEANSSKLKLAKGRSSSGKRRAANLEELVDSLSRAYNESVGQALERYEYNFVLTDPRLPDHPIVYVSDGFLRMSGYPREEVVGRNCRFLQGPGTDRGTVMEIRDAIREERSCQVRILNYTKQGRPFWNLFHMAPIYSKQTCNVIHYVGVQTPVSPNPISGVVVGGTVDEFVECNTMKPCVNDGDSPQPVESPMNMRLRGGAVEAEDMEQEGKDDDIDEDSCVEISDVLKERAALAIQLVTCELTQSSRVKGDLAQKRHTGLSESAASGVVCSSLMVSLTRIQQSFVLANPNLPDMPIVYASDVFCEMTGYSRDEVVGRNCRFLQGPGTDPKDVQKIRDVIKEEQACTVKILNYRKDKTPFHNFLHVAPVRSSDGKVAFYVGVQLDMTDVDADMSQEIGMSAHAKQLGAVGVVRVAVRSLQGSGLRRTLKRTI